MTRGGMLALVLLVLEILGMLGAVKLGPGEAAGRSRGSQDVQPRTSRADFIVLTWYRRDDALATFQYQVYDVRKGEYTAAVDAWIKDVRTKYPGYLVLVRTVDLRNEAGETEALKVGSVVHRELMVAAARSGVVL